MTENKEKVQVSKVRCPGTDTLREYNALAEVRRRYFFYYDKIGNGKFFAICCGKQYAVWVPSGNVYFLFLMDTFPFENIFFSIATFAIIYEMASDLQILFTSYKNLAVRYF